MAKESPTPAKDWTGTGEIAARLGVSHSTARKMLTEAGTPVTVLKKKWRIKKTDAEQFLKKAMPVPLEELVSIVQISERLGITSYTARIWLRETGTPVVTLANRRFVQKDVAEFFIKEFLDMKAMRQAQHDESKRQQEQAN